MGGRHGVCVWGGDAAVCGIQIQNPASPQVQESGPPGVQTNYQHGQVAHPIPNCQTSNSKLKLNQPGGPGVQPPWCQHHQTTQAVPIITQSQAYILFSEIPVKIGPYPWGKFECFAGPGLQPPGREHHQPTRAARPTAYRFKLP